MWINKAVGFCHVILPSKKPAHLWIECIKPEFSRDSKLIQFKLYDLSFSHAYSWWVYSVKSTWNSDKEWSFLLLLWITIVLLAWEWILLLLILYYSPLIYTLILIPFSSNTLCNETSGIWNLFSHPFPAGKGTAACSSGNWDWVCSGFWVIFIFLYVLIIPWIYTILCLCFFLFHSVG